MDRTHRSTMATQERLNRFLARAGVAPDANDAGPLVNVVDFVPAG